MARWFGQSERRVKALLASKVIKRPSGREREKESHLLGHLHNLGYQPTRPSLLFSSGKKTRPLASPPCPYIHFSYSLVGGARRAAFSLLAVFSSPLFLLFPCHIGCDSHSDMPTMARVSTKEWRGAMWKMSLPRNRGQWRIYNSGQNFFRRPTQTIERTCPCSAFALSDSI